MHMDFFHGVWLRLRLKVGPLTVHILGSARSMCLSKDNYASGNES